MSFVQPSYLLALLVVVCISTVLHRRARLQNQFLLGFSLFFYAYWDYRFVALLATTIVIDWAIAGRIAATANETARRRWLIASMTSNLGILAAFKYADFFIDSLRELLGSLGLAANPQLLGLVLPIGISFYTFQSISYVVDVYRRELAPCRSLIDYGLYVAFFPQLVAGPIERGKRLLPQIQGAKRATITQLRQGALLVLYGLFQKLAIGDTAGRVADSNLSTAMPPAAGVAVGLVAFSLQIYGDFAGYSNIARGSAKLLGVELMQNFREPYFATSVTAFWRRWHISLSTFLRDYLYLPLGGNRGGRLRTAANLMTVMLIGGLWHGAAWKFVIWGGLHGLFLTLEKLVFPPAAQGRLVAVPRALLTFCLVTLSWAFFRAPSATVAVDWLSALATLAPGTVPLDHVVLLMMVILFAAPLDILARRSGDATTLVMTWPWWARGVLYAALAWATLGAIGGRHAFLYFQF